MADSLRKCAICGNDYPVCRTCEEVISFKPWRTIVDTVEHYKIHIVLNDYTNKHITKEEAREMLQKCDIANYKTFLPHIVSAIDEILDRGNKTNKKKAKEDSVIAEENKDSE